MMSCSRLIRLCVLSCASLCMPILVNAQESDGSQDASTRRCALRFDGVDDVVTVPSSPSLDVDGAVTVEAWVMPLADNVSGAGVVTKMNGDGSSPVYGIMAAHGSEPNRFRFQIDTINGGVRSGLPTPSLTSGRWYHVAGVYDESGDLRVYLNGVLTSELLSPEFAQLKSSETDVLVGYTEGSFQSGFNGIIDEVRIWDHSRTSAQILENMFVRVDGAAEGLVGYWKFNERSGQAIADRSKAQNGGFLGVVPTIDDADPQRVLCCSPVSVCVP